MRTDDCAPGCDWPVTGYHAKRGGKVLCGIEVKPLSDNMTLVSNPLMLLESAAYVQRTGEMQPGDEELAVVLDTARSQLLIRPSDPVCWAIIRLLLVDITEEEINQAAKKAREQQRVSGNGGN